MNKAILAHLSRKDPVLGGVIRAVGPRRLAPPEDCHPFQVLAQAIAHQQLNGTAANTILKRLVDGCGEGAFPTPHMVIAAPEETLRAAGFSRAKVAALKDLAGKTLDSVVPDGATLAQLPDEEIIARLTPVRGIGRWTVAMLLILHPWRPDVWPVADYGVQKGFAKTFRKRKLPTPKELMKHGEKWRPHRSVAAWYFWRAVDQSG